MWKQEIVSHQTTASLINFLPSCHEAATLVIGTVKWLDLVRGGTLDAKYVIIASRVSDSAIATPPCRETHYYPQSSSAHSLSATSAAPPRASGAPPASWRWKTLKAFA